VGSGGEGARVALVVVAARELVGARIVVNGVLGGHVQRDGVGSVPRGFVERADLDGMRGVHVREVGQSRILVGDGDLVDDLRAVSIVVHQYVSDPGPRLGAGQA